MRELCRIQTFPDGYEVTGGRTAYQRQIGNAVPSALAELLAREIIKQLLGGRPKTGPLTLAPERRLPVPKPARRRPVAAKYRDLVGDHDPHPGTGKGYAAASRKGS